MLSMKKTELKALVQLPLFRWIAAIAVTTIVIVWIAAFLRIRFDYQAELQVAMRMNDNLAAAFAEQIQTQFGQIDDTLLFIKQQYEKHGGVNAAIVDKIRHSANGSVMNFSIIDSQGKFLDSFLPGADKINVADREFFTARRDTATDALMITKPVTNRFTGHTTFHLSRRLNRADGSFGGIVICGVEPKYFSEFYRKLNLSEGYAITVIGLDGVVRMRQSANGMDSGQDLSGSPNFFTMKNEHSGSFVEKSLIDGERRLISFHWVERYPLIVRVSMIEPEAFVGFREQELRHIQIAAAFSALFLLVFGMLFWLIVKKDRATKAQHEHEERFSGAFDHAPVGMVIVSPDGRIIQVNECICRMFGYVESELLGRSVLEMSYPEDAGVNVDLRDQMLAGEIESYCIEKRYRHKSGAILVGLLTASLVRDKQGRPLYFINHVEDMTERKQAELKARIEKKRLVSILRISQAKTTVQADLNDLMLEAVLELSQSELGFIYFYSEDEETFALHAWSKSVMEKCRIIDKQTKFRLDTAGFWAEAARQRKPVTDNDILTLSPSKKGYPDGHVTISRFMSAPIFIDGKIVAVVSVANKKEAYTQLDMDQLVLMADSLWNIIERRRAEEELKSLNASLDRRVVERTAELDSAYEKLKEQNEELEALIDELNRLTMTDALTGVGNRRGFDDCLHQKWRHALRQKLPISLLMVDIDYFKRFNDLYGHQRGDECLIAVAGVLPKCIKRATDHVARYGGEEFAVLLPDTDLPGAMAVAETIRRAVEATRISEQEAPVTVSVGVATVTPSTEGLTEELVAMADKALYEAKSAGRNRICSLQN